MGFKNVDLFETLEIEVFESKLSSALVRVVSDCVKSDSIETSLLGEDSGLVAIVERCSGFVLQLRILETVSLSKDFDQ